MAGQSSPNRSVENTADVKNDIDLPKEHTEEIENVEHDPKAIVHSNKGDLNEEEIWALRQRYPLLAAASQEKLDALDKAVLKKLDWKFLPIITVMLLMKYVGLSLPLPLPLFFR